MPLLVALVDKSDVARLCAAGWRLFAPAPGSAQALLVRDTPPGATWEQVLDMADIERQCAE